MSDASELANPYFRTCGAFLALLILAVSATAVSVSSDELPTRVFIVAPVLVAVYAGAVSLFFGLLGLQHMFRVKVFRGGSMVARWTVDGRTLSAFERRGSHRSLVGMPSGCLPAACGVLGVVAVLSWSSYNERPFGWFAIMLVGLLLSVRGLWRMIGRRLRGAGRERVGVLVAREGAMLHGEVLDWASPTGVSEVELDEQLRLLVVHCTRRGSPRRTFRVEVPLPAGEAEKVRSTFDALRTAHHLPPVEHPAPEGPDLPQDAEDAGTDP